MTLIPVSNISVVGASASTSGAGRWIGQRSTSSAMGSPWSIVSPSRLKIRPSVSRPTGTVIGAPVSITSVPRARPSVVSIATARTRSSPRCCCTSQVRYSSCWAAMSSVSSALAASGRLTMIAWLISGSLSGNTASMTTPVTSSIRPVLRSVLVVLASVVADMLCVFSLSASDALGARDDFHDLLGDLRLARPVHLERQVVDQGAGVVRGVLHRGHPCTVLGRRGFEQRPVDRHLDVVGNQALEDLLGIRLVLEVADRPLVLAALAGVGGGA